MVDPVATPLINVAVALTSMLLNATQQQQAAAILTDARDPITSLTQAILGRRGTKKDIERTIHKDLTLRMHEMSERCHRDGINSDRLASPCAEVEDILNAIDDHEQLLEQAVHDPDAVRALFEEQARSSRIQIDESLVPYFDELIKAVVEQYIDYAERSPNYLHVAAKQSLKNDKEHREAYAKNLDAHAVTHDKLDTLSSKLSEVARQENEPRRVFFGSRPDAVTGDRYIERDEKKHLNALIADPTKHRTVLVGMRGCGKTQLASLVAQQCENANWVLVAWINAASRESIQSDLVELAKQLGIGTSDHPTQDQVIHSFLSRVKSAKPADRLIILDNVENIDDLRGLIPSGDGLRVIATTTNNTGWDDHGWNTLKVGVFVRDQSIKHLLDVTDDEDHDAADALAERLGDLPIAITQASSTCKRLKISLNNFNEILNKFPIEEVLDPTSSSRDQEGIISTFIASYNLTFDRIHKEKKGKQIAHIATCILQALCYLSESGVPTHWLRNEGELDSLRAYAILVDSSLIQQSHDKTVTRIHRLCSYSLRKLFSRNDEEVTALQTAAMCLQCGAGLAYDETEPTKQISMVKDFERQLLSCIIQDHSKGILCSKGVHEAMDALRPIQIQHPEEFADLEDMVKNAFQELLNWDWNDPAHHYELV
jgi:hypothetical protein avisC_02045